MEALNLKQADAMPDRQRAARVRRDARVIDDALGDERLSGIAEIALHIAAGILERAEAEGRARAPMSDEDRTAFARFGVDTSKSTSIETLLSSKPAVEGMNIHAQLMASAVGIADVARTLGVDPSRLRQRIKEGTLLAIRRPQSRGWLIPAFQLTQTGVIPHLARVLGSARTHLSVVSVARAFELPDDELDGMSPRNWLISGGDPSPVERLVAGL